MKQNINQQLMESFFYMSRQIKHTMEYDSPLANLTLIQVETLIFVKKNPRSQMLEIAHYFNIKKPSATSIINTLSRMQLVKRIATKEDRRIVQIELTIKGIKLLDAELTKKKERMAGIVSQLSLHDKSELLRIINLVVTPKVTPYEEK